MTHPKRCGAIKRHQWSHSASMSSSPGGRAREAGKKNPKKTGGRVGDGSCCVSTSPSCSNRRDGEHSKHNKHPPSPRQCPAGCNFQCVCACARVRWLTKMSITNQSIQRDTNRTVQKSFINHTAECMHNHSERSCAAGFQAGLGLPVLSYLKSCSLSG